MLKSKWLFLGCSLVAMNAVTAHAMLNVANYQELNDALVNGDEIALTEDIKLEGNLNNVNSNVYISGQGHVIDGQGHSGIKMLTNTSVTSENITFQNFKSTSGSVLYMRNMTDIGHISGNFYNNSADSWGGAMLLGFFGNNFEKGEISGYFEKNSSGSDTKVAHGIGGAMFLVPTGVIDSINGTFIENSSKSNSNKINLVANDASGGAITTFTNVKKISGFFQGNYTKNNKGPSEGGAIHYCVEEGAHVPATITGEFIENHSEGLISMGGGIHFDGGIIENLSGQFDKNYVTTFDNGYAQGGALAVDKAAVLKNIEGTSFKNNSAFAEQGIAHGGAIALFDYYNYGSKAQIENINNSLFENNYAIASDGTAKGGAIYVFKSSSVDNIVNSSFLNNHVEGNEESKGGAIYSESDLTISAQNGKTEFTDNKVNGVSNAIFMENARLTLKALNDGEILFNDEIDGSSGYKIAFDGDETGNIVINNNIHNADITLENTNVNVNDVDYFNDNNNITINSGKFNVSHLGLNDEVTANSITLNGGVLNIKEADVDLASKKMGTINGDILTQNGGVVNVEKMIVHTEADADVTSIKFVNGDNDVVVTHNDKQVEKAIAPIYKYDVTYKDGDFTFTRNGFNPGVFENDVFALSSLNMQSSAVKEALNQPQILDYTKARVWATPFYNDDMLTYKNFYNVDSQNYGVVAGVDSMAYALNDNWTSVYTVFGAYNDGTDRYQDVKIDNRSWLAGLKASVYNGGFYGDALVDYARHKMNAWTAFGKDSNTVNGYGFATKAGYKHNFDNVELDTSAMLSWQEVEGDNLASKSGEKISTDDYSRLMLTPQIKLGYKFNHLKPYALVRYNYALNENGGSKVNNIALPNIKGKDYAEYGLGIEMINTKQQSGHAQILRHDGGREGWAITAGYRYNF